LRATAVYGLVCRVTRLARPDALIFDLDGTLWDTCAVCAAAWNRVLARLGIAYREIVAADVRAVTGRPHTDGIRAAFPDLSQLEVERISAHTQIEDNLAIAEHGGELFPGVRYVVPRLREVLPLLIVSNCQRGYVETFLETSGLGASFVDFECWGNTGQTKTANVRALIERNHLRAPWLVGDTEGDREAARDNGVPFVHAVYGFGGVAESDERIERFADLLSLIR
jgi:phosphoglycolate phosphatase